MSNTLESIRPWRTITRRKSRQIKVGRVAVGGDAPIAVQSMTNTLTHDVQATIDQIMRLEAAGADIVRVSCPDPDSSAAMREITDSVECPIVADIHFHYKRGNIKFLSKLQMYFLRLQPIINWRMPQMPRSIWA